MRQVSQFVREGKMLRFLKFSGNFIKIQWKKHGVTNHYGGTVKWDHLSDADDISRWRVSFRISLQQLYVHDYGSPVLQIICKLFAVQTANFLVIICKLFGNYSQFELPIFNLQNICSWKLQIISLFFICKWKLQIKICKLFPNF